MDNKMKSTFGGVVLGVVMLLVAFNVSGITVDETAFGLFDGDLQDQAAIDDPFGINYTEEGYVVLEDGQSNVPWTSVKYDVENQTTLDSYIYEVGDNASVDITVTGYNSTGGQVGTVTESEVREEGLTTLDISGLGQNVEQVDVEYNLDRTSDSITSPEVQGYEGFEEGTVPYLNYLVAVFGIAVLLFSLRDL